MPYTMEELNNRLNAIHEDSFGEQDKSSLKVRIESLERERDTVKRYPAVVVIVLSLLGVGGLVGLPALARDVATKKARVVAEEAATKAAAAYVQNNTTIGQLRAEARLAAEATEDYRLSAKSSLDSVVKDAMALAMVRDRLSRLEAAANSLESGTEVFNVDRFSKPDPRQDNLSKAVVTVPLAGRHTPASIVTLIPVRLQFDHHQASAFPYWLQSEVSKDGKSLEISVHVGNGLPPKFSAMTVHWLVSEKPSVAPLTLMPVQTQ